MAATSTRKPARRSGKAGPAAVPAPTPVPPMRMRNFRCDDATWDAAMAQAKADGLDVSAVIRHYLRGYAGL